MKLIWQQIKINVKKSSTYKLNFIMLCIAIAPLHILQAIFSWIIGDRFSTLNGWSSSELVFLYSLVLISYSIAQIFCKQFRNFDEFLIKGRLDQYLTQPLPVAFNIMFSEINIMEFFSQFIPAVILLLYACLNTHIRWSFFNVAALIVSILSGSVIQISLFILIGLSAFFTLAAGRIEQLYYSIKEFSNYPLSVYGNKLLLFFTLVIPLGAINYYPACIILCKDIPYTFVTTLYIPISAIALLAATMSAWKIALKHYSICGS